MSSANATELTPNARTGRANGRAIPLACRRHPFVHRLACNLRDRCDVAAGSKIILGVSGGADSIALLLGCLVLGARRSRLVQPHVVHIDHGLRPESTADASFVRDLCERLDAPFRVDTIDLAGSSGNLAAEARLRRYDALARAAREIGARHIAVAHHADDQCETVLMNLCRGAGTDGLSGMSWMRPLAEGSDLRLVRPLLDQPRRDLEAFCRAAGVTWRDDPTNERLDLARTRLRHEVTPVLEDLWPGAAMRIASAAETIDELQSALDAVLQMRFGPADRRRWVRSDLAALPPALIAAGLRRAALDAIAYGSGADALSLTHLEQAALAVCDAARRPRTFDWPCGLCLRISARDVALLTRPSSHDPVPFKQEEE